jgi:hypothetical protein
MFNHQIVFKVFSNQSLSELKERNVLISFFKGGILSKPCVPIGELPEFLGKLKPCLEGIGSRILFATLLHEVYDFIPELINLIGKLIGWPFCIEKHVIAPCIRKRV